MEYKVTVYVMTPYSTIVSADTEEKAIELALVKDGPSMPAYHEEGMYEEWVSDGVSEFPNLGKNETPEIEEYND
jgi:hypothetical protein